MVCNVPKSFSFNIHVYVDKKIKFLNFNFKYSDIKKK